MNKQNKILLGALTLIVACTIGYALFSESITINGTASASGEWNIVTTCTTGISSDSKENLAYESNFGDKEEGGYENDSCSVTGNTVTFSTDLKYPSATRYFEVAITNNGKISAYIDLNETNFENIQICKYNVSDNTLVDCNVDETIQISETGTMGISEYSYMGINLLGYKSGVTYYSTDDEDSLIANFFYNPTGGEDPTGYKLPPGATMYLGIYATWSDHWTDQTKYLKYNMTNTIIIKQISE